MLLFRGTVLSLAFLMQASTTLGSFVPRSFDAAIDVDLGMLDSVEAFFKLVGTNTTNWERVEDAPREVVDPAALALDTSPNNATSLLPRQSEECAARTGWEWIVCENMPESWVKKTLFGAMLIYYSPRLLFEFLTSCGRLVYGGDYVWRIRSAGQLGRRSEIETQIQAHVDSFGVVEEYSLYNEYSFDTAAQEIHYRATGGSFTSDASTSTSASGKRIDPR
ncbi:hypothetical protein CMUS01_16445 [Colletotrichum musicola]|uniref:Uncharacterized protein n=1 Tax=Colletotrichum musicola TaxID=2175873 RepID=A0A8H6MIF2_9PEZI|nr:hypothetical protein CMUS01_16445 [Colletotrichum musicola]